MQARILINCLAFGVDYKKRFDFGGVMLPKTFTEMCFIIFNCFDY